MSKNIFWEIIYKIKKKEGEVLATRNIYIEQLDIGAKKPLKTKQTVQSNDYVEILVNLYENNSIKSFSSNTIFEAYGKLYKSKVEITPIPNSQFTVIDAEKGQFCLLLTPTETQVDDVLMLQINVKDDQSSISGHNHGVSHYSTQYFLINILKSQHEEDVFEGSAIVGTFNVGTRRVGEGLTQEIMNELINEVKEEVSKNVEQDFVKIAMFEAIKEQREQDEFEKEVMRNALKEVVQNIEKDVKKEVAKEAVQELLKENKDHFYKLEEFQTSSSPSALSDKFKKKLKKSR